ncbi:TPA: hypothetical protein PTV68_002480 [Clostridium botulinum]|uniref:hypothetical protein n=1 Tax=Clostridium botulinum TaxID=1491 RepID=UPI0029ABE49F|nr:hypothetical protein [Clostridium botulinum]HDK7188739.1 hypothetical protein [Clostridium botulinum]HDK7215658.1 hypothetical protein [Clostridium botulinum]HDK7231412.1 hypothetical protein [Clostridium botulinum]HDK7261162.1 hypothetical protein [Clostridium botulinum]
MSNKERAEKTYILLQQRKRDRERVKKNDIFALYGNNMARMLRKNSRGKREMGQF